MAQVILSKKYKSFNINDLMTEGDTTYKVVGIDKLINSTGGTDYIVEETTQSKILKKLKIKKES